MKNNKNISLLREYIIDEKLGQINIDLLEKEKIYQKIYLI